MAIKITKESKLHKESDLLNDLQDSIKGIHSMEEDIASGQMLLTFFDRAHLIKMSQFIKVMQSIMMDYYEEKDNLIPYKSELEI